MSEAKSGGMGLNGTLLVVFIILKLVGVIAWSWWWVLAPLWIPVAVAVLAFGAVVGYSYLEHRLKRRRAPQRVATGRRATIAERRRADVDYEPDLYENPNGR